MSKVEGVHWWCWQQLCHCRNGKNEISGDVKQLDKKRSRQCKQEYNQGVCRQNRGRKILIGAREKVTSWVFNHSFFFKMIWNLGNLERCWNKWISEKMSSRGSGKIESTRGRCYTFQEIKGSWFQGKDQQTGVWETVPVLGWDVEIKHMESERYQGEKNRIRCATFQLLVLRKAGDFNRGQHQRHSLLA